MDKEDLAANRTFLASLILAMDHKLVELPRYVWHYRNAIWTAIEGDTTLLEQAVNTVSMRTEKFKRSKAKSGVKARWLTGMVNNYDRVYVTLAKWLDRLLTYWSDEHGEVDSERHQSLARIAQQSSEVERPSGPKLSRRVRGGKVEEI